MTKQSEADSPPSIDTQNRIMVSANPASGSHVYVAAKRPGDAVNDVFEGLDGWFEAQNGAIDHIAQISNSMVAMTAFAPAAKLWSQASIDFWRDIVTDKIREARHFWSNMQEKAFLQEAVHGEEYARFMKNTGLTLAGDTGVNEALNYGFFTHNRFDRDDPLNNSLNRKEGDEILALFSPDKSPEDWPNLILTSSHALVRDHQDVSGIMKGFHALTTHLFSQRGPLRRLPLIEREDALGPESSQEKKTVMLSSVYNNHNAWVNGATLLARLNYLDGLYEKEQQSVRSAADDTPAKRAQREKAYLGTGDAAMSPASIRLAKLMLKLMVTEPEKVDIPGREAFESEAWQHDLTLSFQREPVTLRPDAREVLEHIKLVGYSKGGNIATDALRYLVLELQRDRPKALQADDKTKMVQYTDVDGQVFDMRDANISSLMRNCGILAINPGISPLTDREKSLGIRRLSVRNKRDWITAHLFERHSITERDGTNDDVYVIEPVDLNGNLGHGYVDALGSLDEGKKGYLTDSSKVSSSQEDFREMESRLKCFLASCYNQVGIKSVMETQPGQYALEFSAGASEKDANQTVALLEEYLTKQFGAVTIHFDWRHDSSFQVSAAEPGTRLSKTELGKALQRVENESKAFVGHNVYRDLGVEAPGTSRGRG